MMTWASSKLPKSSRFRHSSRSLSWTLSDIRILPRATRRDVNRLHALALEPVLERIRDELRAVVAAQVPGHTVTFHRRLHDRDHVHRPDRPRAMHRQTFPCVFVEQGQHAKARAALGLVLHEVPAPHLLPLGCGLAHTPHPPLFLADLQSFHTSRALHALAVHFRACSPKQRGDAPVAMARM